VGDPPFAGSTAQAVLGKIIAGKRVSATEERASVPANVDGAIRKALEKLPADRFASAQDFVRALGDEHFRYGELATAGAGGAAAGPWNRLTMVTTALAALFAAAFGWARLRPESPGPVTVFSIRIPEDQFFDPTRGDFDLSSDVFVYRGVDDDGQSQLFARRLSGREATPIRETRNGWGPAISPNGEEVAFYVGSSIFVVSLQGGGLRTITEAASLFGTDVGWSPGGAWIYYTDSSEGLSRVPAGGGGAPQMVTEVDTAAGESRHVAVHVLPGGKAALYTAYSGAVGTIRTVDLETFGVKDLDAGQAGQHARYSAGYLLFQDEDYALWARPFDVERLEFTSEPMLLADGLLRGLYATSFAVSTDRLVYRTGAGQFVTPYWRERDGTANVIDPEWSFLGDLAYSNPVLSPDGTQLAISLVGDQGGYDIWVKQLDTGPRTPVTTDGAQNIRPIWSIDGQFLTFVSDRGSPADLWTKRADGGGPATLVLNRPAANIAEAVYSPDEEVLFFREGSNTAADIYAKRLPDGEVVAVLVTDALERTIDLSPDGRWLAYVSNRSNQEQVYVRSSSPDADSETGTQVSVNGGVEPIFAHNGRELFYRTLDDQLVAIQFTEDPTFTVSGRDTLFSMAGYLTSNGRPVYDVSPNDSSFVMLRIIDQAADTELIVWDNWAEALRERVPN